MKITAGKKIDRDDIGRLIGIVKSWYTIIQRYYQSGKEYPEAVLNDLKASISGVLKDYGQTVGASSSIGRCPVTAAESYGWEVPDNMAQEAYDFAINSGYWDENSLNADIVNAISTDELAACLAFIFRMNDFQEWDDYLNGEGPEDDEYEDGDEDDDEDE